MEAFKCDRCGKYYDADTLSYKDKVYEIFKKSKNTSLDLCSECMHDLSNWFDKPRKLRIKYSDEDVPLSDPNKRIDISEGLDPKTGEWGHNS